MTQQDGYVFMRDAPFAEARKTAKLYDNTPITVLDCGTDEYRTDVSSGNQGKWCQVEANGQTGYVYNSYIKAGVPSQRATPKPRPKPESKPKHYIMTQEDGHVYMRSEPYADAKKTTKLEDHTPVTILKCGEDDYRDDVTSGNHGKWCQVRAKGKTGYVYNSYIQTSTP